MANKTDGSPQGTLQRGKACLRCRKRKMRCDGNKPACQQCTRAKKAEGCEYDDGKGKTRTQILRETIARLETRIRELEDPDYISPNVVLHDPHGRQNSESSSSSLGSPGSASLSIPHSPFPSGSASPPHGSWTRLPGVPSPSYSPEIFYEDPTPQYQTPLFELGPMLLEIFAPHRRQCGLEINLGRLRDSLTQPLSEQPHPSLMNAIYLWACFVSRPEPLCQHEEHFLTQALEAHRDGLRVGDKIVDVIRASCLLSLYFFANGRFFEGSYHSSAAAALAVQCGLHAGVSQQATSWLVDSNEPFDLKPPKSDYREGERILTFWQVYNLDRCWSVALRKPFVIPDGSEALSSIDCPWPQDVEEYETGHINAGSTFHTVRAFFEGDVSPTGFSSQALRSKASALFARADQLAASWDQRMKPSGRFQEEIQALELSITRFIPTLIPVHQLDSTVLEDKPIIIVSHTLAHAAVIHLYQRFAQDDPVAYDKCSRAASACVAIIKHIGDLDYDFLDPIIGPCWTAASDIYIRDLNNLEAAWPPISTTDVRNELGTILYAMNALSTRFPLLGVSASKIQKRLAEAQDLC